MCICIILCTRYSIINASLWEQITFVLLFPSSYSVPSVKPLTEEKEMRESTFLPLFSLFAVFIDIRYSCCVWIVSILSLLCCRLRDSVASWTSRGNCVSRIRVKILKYSPSRRPRKISQTSPGNEDVIFRSLNIPRGFWSRWNHFELLKSPVFQVGCNHLTGWHQLQKIINFKLNIPEKGKKIKWFSCMCGFAFLSVMSKLRPVWLSNPNYYGGCKKIFLRFNIVLNIF